MFELLLRAVSWLIVGWPEAPNENPEYGIDIDPNG